MTEKLFNEFTEYLLKKEGEMDFRKRMESQNELQDHTVEKERMGRKTLICLLEQAEETIETRAKHLTFHEYSRERIAAQGEVRDSEARLNIAALGLSGESGEFLELLLSAVGLSSRVDVFVEMVKKTNFHSWQLDKEQAIKELGDILWYINFAADAIGTSLEEIARKNNEKLRARYPNGFNLDDASKRQVEQSVIPNEWKLRNQIADAEQAGYERGLKDGARRKAMIPEWSDSEDFGGSDFGM